MSLLLIDPPRAAISKGTLWREIKRNLPSLGLTYIAAYLEQHGHKVSIIDMNAEMTTIDGLLESISQNRYRIIGITATTVHINSALIIAERIKQIFSDVKIAMGGAHPSAMTDEVLSNKYVDYVVRGEGELTMLDLVSGKKEEEILGLSFKKNSQIFHNRPRPVIENLDVLPLPARHHLPMDRYNPTPGSYKRLPMVSMITSRGCPGQCTFCNTDIFGKKIRFRSPQSIITEILFLIENYKAKEIYFYDDTFTMNRKNVEDLCNIIIRDNIDITWSCMSRVDCINFALLELMKKAGCHSVCYGIESADEGVLGNIKKRIPLGRVPEVIDWTKKAGIDVRVAFMLGNPGETEETLQKTIRYAISLDPDIYVFNITTPLPGTEMFKWAKANGYLKTLDWDKYDLGQVVMDLPTVSPGVIKKYYKLAYRRSMFRLKYIIKKLRRINSFESLLMHFKIVKVMVLNIVFNK